MQITQVIDEWAHVTSSLPVLQVVRCVYCYLTNTKASGNNTSFFIQELKLPFNSLNSIPKWVTNISSRVPWFWLQCHPCSNPIALLKHTQPGIPNPELQFLELQLLRSYSWEQMGKDQDYSFARVRYARSHIRIHWQHNIAHPARLVTQKNYGQYSWHYTQSLQSSNFEFEGKPAKWRSTPRRILCLTQSWIIVA